MRHQPACGVNRVAAIQMTPAMVAAALKATAAKVKPKEAHPFSKGDGVVYPAHGVGRVERVGFEEIAGHRLNLIHISFEDNQMTLRVPVAQARSAGLRKLGQPANAGRGSHNVEGPAQGKPAYVGQAVPGVSREDQHR